jgi:hypothetical protein
MNKTTTASVTDAIEALRHARINLDNARLEGIEAVRSSGEDFFYDRQAGIYIGPDRHNDEWTVTWDVATAQKAAGQMFTLGKRECNWDGCLCKRSSRGHTFRQGTTRNF